MVRVAGRVDHTNSDDFLEQIGAEAERVTPGGGMVIDLSKLEFISSAGLRALMIAQRAAKKAKARLFVTGIRGVVKEVFRISKFDAMLSVEKSAAEAVKQVSDEAAAAFAG